MTTLLCESPLQSQLKKALTKRHQLNTGPALLKASCGTNGIANNFFFRSINVLNTLPVTITNATSLFLFKRLLSNFDPSSFLFGHFN